MQFFSVRNLLIFCGICLVGPVRLNAVGTEDEQARQILLQALENQYHGNYQATVEIIDEPFLGGRDSLSGQVEFSDEIGERRMCLAGPNKAFEYRSFRFGKEQWVTDDQSHRIRRIANRQWKKGMFGTLLTYEDMLKLPTAFLLEYSACKGLKVNDSSYQLTMSLKPLFQSFYSRLEVTVAKNPVLLKSMTFYGQQQQKLKTMDITGYTRADGKWLISDLTVSDCDSLSRLQMCFRHFSFAPAAAVQKGMGKGADFSLLSKRASDGLEGVDSSGEAESLEESTEEISN